MVSIGVQEIEYDPVGRDEVASVVPISIHPGWFLARVMAGSDSRWQHSGVSAEVHRTRSPIRECIGRLGNFINKLRPDVKAEMRVLEHNNLGRAMDLVQKIEDKLAIIRGLRIITRLPPSCPN